MRKSLIAAILITTNYSSCLAQVCQRIEDTGIALVINHSEIGRTPLPVANMAASIDVAKRQVCFDFRGLEAMRTSITPPHVCLDIDDDNNDPTVIVTLPNGQDIDVSKSFSAETLRPWFDHRYKQCVTSMGRMAHQ